METNASTESQNEDHQSNRSDESSSEEPSNQLNDIDELEAVNHESESQAPIIDADERNGNNDDENYDQTVVDDAGVENVEETTSVEQRLRKISEEIEKFSNNNESEMRGPHSFFSLQDLIKTLRPSDKKIIPQIDSDYSNTMHVLGETASIVGGDDTRKIKTIDLRQTNRALY